MRIGKIAASLTLLASLAMPLATFAQDHHYDHDRRYYDREHKDYHHWDAREDAAYRHWAEENHRHYVDFNRLNARDQQRYWAWRHEHPNWR